MRWGLNNIWKVLRWLLSSKLGTRFIIITVSIFKWWHVLRLLVLEWVCWLSCIMMLTLERTIVRIQIIHEMLLSLKFNILRGDYRIRIYLWGWSWLILFVFLRRLYSLLLFKSMINIIIMRINLIKVLLILL